MHALPRPTPRNGAARPAWWLSLLAVACVPGQSLDTPAGIESSSGGAPSTDPTTAASQSTSGTDDGELPPDVPADVPDPVACPADCDPTPAVDWTWDEEPEPAGPGDPPASGQRELVTIVNTPGLAPSDRAVFVAENRDGVPWLTRIDLDGTYQWSVQIDTTCFCRVVSVTVDEFTGQLMFSGIENLEPAGLMVLGRFNPSFADTAWVGFNSLNFAKDAMPRVGPHLAVNGVLSVVVLLEDDASFGSPPGEHLELQLFENFGSILAAYSIDTQAPTNDPHAPVGATNDGETFAIAYPSWTGASVEGYVIWAKADSSPVMDAQLLPSAPDAVLTDASKRTVIAGHRETEPGRSELWVTERTPLSPHGWSTVAEFQTTTVQPASLGATTTGDIYVAARVDLHPELPGTVHLQHIDASGEPQWAVELPGLADPGLRSMVMTVDSQDGVAIATLVDGRLHVERREPSCQCD